MHNEMTEQEENDYRAELAHNEDMAEEGYRQMANGANDEKPQTDDF